MSSESGVSYGDQDEEYMMSDNDYGAPSMDDMVDHDIDDTSTSMDHMAEDHHYYDYDATTVHDMESYTDFESTSVNAMMEHYYDYKSNDLVEPYIDYDSTSMDDMVARIDYHNMQSARAHNPPPMHAKGLHRHTSSQDLRQALHIMFMMTTPTMIPNLDDHQGHGLKTATAVKHTHRPKIFDKAMHLTMMTQEDGAQCILA